MGQYNNAVFDRIPVEKQKAVLDAAAAEFAKGGFSAANINVIASEAGVSVGSIYQYFGSKENCFLSVLEEGLRELESALNHALEGDGKPQEKFAAVLHLIPQHSRTHRSILKLYNELTGEGLTPQLRDFCVRFESLSAETYSALIKEAQHMGAANPAMDPRVAAFCMDNLFMMLQFSCSCEYFEQRRKVYLGDTHGEDDEYLVNEMLNFISRALGAPHP